MAGHPPPTQVFHGIPALHIDAEINGSVTVTVGADEPINATNRAGEDSRSMNLGSYGVDVSVLVSLAKGPEVAAQRWERIAEVATMNAALIRADWRASIAREHRS